MRNLERMPRPQDLMDNPELAVLVALETTLLAALRALLAVHTDLLEDRFPRTTTPSGFWAERPPREGCAHYRRLLKTRSACRRCQALPATGGK